MTVRIRMKKISDKAKGRYNFRIVVIKKTASRDSRPIEEIGNYDPSQKPAFVKFKKDRYDYWVSKGAQPTDTVATLYKKSNKG
jgi:small subunit ribosomal protein S16